MSCNSCHRPLQYCTCTPSCDDCMVQLDTKCVFYHKDNNNTSLLTGLGLQNGATLNLILETIDEKIRQLNVLNASLPILRADYVVNNLQGFLTAVDTEIGLIKARLTAGGL